MKVSRVRASWAVLSGLVLSASLMLALVSAAPASASYKPYSLVISPATVSPGSATIKATFTNENPSQQLGSANLTPPSGFTVSGATLQPGTPGSASVAGNVVRLRNLALATGQSVTTTMAVTAPAAACPNKAGTWGVEAKQANDFSGLPGNDFNLDPANSSLTTTVTGPCALRFGTQPHSATVGQPITGTDYTTSGPPVTVEILDSAGHVVTSSTAPVTVALGQNPGSSTLAGTQTRNAVNGVATFSDLSLAQPANGYTLSASAPSLTGSTSSSFNEQSQSVSCSENQTCQSQVGNSGGDMRVVASPGSAGTLTESVNANNGKQLDCTGYTSADPNTYEFYVTSVDRSKVLTQTIRQPAIPLVGTTTAILGTQQECYGAPYEFVTSSGTPAAAGTLPDGSSGFIGLLPSCGTAGASVCVASRSSTPDLTNGLGFDIVLTVNVPAGLVGDPWGR